MVAIKKKLRPIRSFVRREGRITPAQERALKELWPRYGVEWDKGLLDFTEIFGHSRPVIVEIGFGNGTALIEAATAHPENDYLGIEIHRPGVGQLLRALDAGGLSNVRVVNEDAKEVLTYIPDHTLAGIHLFFPDPWPKKRHHKRRLLQPEFVQLVCAKLVCGGYFHLATDWQDYAEQMLRVLSSSESLVNVAGPNRYTERPESRAVTKFEQRGRTRGHAVFDLKFVYAAEEQ